MRILRIKAIFALLSVLFCAVLSAQERTSNSSSDRIASRQISGESEPNWTNFRPLGASEGLAILGAALESRHRANAGSDCSHLVQAIYEKAGFPYSYVNSFQLYEGIDQFRRVTNLQPGDLAVWKGHVGIVVNPGQHSFFSMLRSGRGVETYDSKYWKRRGTPRFFRYVKAAPVEPLPEVSNATLIPTSLEIRSPAGVEAPATVQPAASVVRVASSTKPTSDQLNAALLKAFRDSEPALRGSDLLGMTRSLTVFDQFEVKTVHLAGNQGWADIQIHEVMSLPAAEVKVNRLWERQRWALQRRDKASWELTIPSNTTYISQEMAVRVMAHQLASLADSNSNSASIVDHKAELARLLTSLLENQTSSGTR